MVQDGGWAMWPLGACSLAFFYLLAYCLSQTRPGAFIPFAQLDQLPTMLRGGDYQATRDAMNSTETVMGSAFSKAIDKVKPTASEPCRQRLEASLVEQFENEATRRLQNIGYLNVIAATAPMIGLLGTVSGMIGAFQTMEMVGMGQPQAFAGSIGEALITTATGLVIGIPAMVAYFILRNRLNSRMQETAEVATDLLDAIPVDASSAGGQ
ncbi:MAG: MotA/TolQ/ExbB proton channel family protein [Verrucomicrobiota bacterium]